MWQCTWTKHSHVWSLWCGQQSDHSFIAVWSSSPSCNILIEFFTLVLHINQPSGHLCAIQLQTANQRVTWAKGHGLQTQDNTIGLDCGDSWKWRLWYLTCHFKTFGLSVSHSHCHCLTVCLLWLSLSLSLLLLLLLLFSWLMRSLSLLSLSSSPHYLSPSHLFIVFTHSAWV